MKCNKCSAEWQAPNNKSKMTNCPFCGASLVEEKPAVKLDGPAQVIKDIVDGKYGSDTIHNRTRCGALFSDLIDDIKNRNLLEVLLKLGVAEQLKKDNTKLSDSDKAKLMQSVCDSLYKDYFSSKRLNEGLNWYSKAMLGIEGNWFCADDIYSANDVVVSERKHTVEPEFNNLFEFLKQKYNLELVRCPAGTFMMGSPSEELGRFDDEKQHQVTISKNFYIGRYPVTQAQYMTVMGYNPSISQGDNNRIITFFSSLFGLGNNPSQCDNNPVENFSWGEAKEFCEKLNKFTKSTRPVGYRFDLPTEAQWEYACRAGTTTSLNSGKNITQIAGYCSNLDEVGWYDGNSGYKTHPVGLKKPNAWGIYDMHGNVWEWCRDWYGEYPSSSCTDPKGPDSSSYRVFRGGGWSSDPRFCRSAYRGYYAPDFEDRDLGFRIALVLSSK